jgi:hypothetical protein
MSKRKEWWKGRPTSSERKAESRTRSAAKAGEGHWKGDEGMPCGLR